VRFTALVLALLVSCAQQPAQVTVDDARQIVAAFIGSHGWTAGFDKPRDVVRDGVLYYAVALGGTGLGDPKTVFVSSVTGDVYDTGFHLEGFASELLPSRPAELAPGKKD
jgi:hypothetical protein